MTPARDSAGTCALVADIGGTHARFALAGPDPAMPLLAASIRQYDVAACASLADAAGDYLQQAGEDVRRGVFAIAGPVQGDVVRMTNHPWRIERAQLQRALGLDDLALANDFVAQAMALPRLRATDTVAVGEWSPPREPGEHACSLVLGPGTGLGVGALLHHGGRAFAQATEAGHVGFAPGNADEALVRERLAARYGRVDNERLLSGPGLVALHRALGELAGERTDDALQPADISAAALAGDARCRRSTDLFFELLGAVAGDLVLALGAWNGVWLSGGMLPHMRELLDATALRRRFEDKGRYAGAMKQVPTRLVLHPQPGLLGAAAIAAGRLPEPSS